MDFSLARFLPKVFGFGFKFRGFPGFQVFPKFPAGFLQVSCGFPAGFLRVSCGFPAGFLRVFRRFLCFSFPKVVFAVRRGFSCVPTLVCSGFPRSFSWLVAGLTRSGFGGWASPPKVFCKGGQARSCNPLWAAPSCIILSTCLHRAHTSPHNLLASLTRLSPSPFFKPLNLWRNTTSRGFEPLQAKPNEFQVYLLSRSGCRAATILALARMLQGLRSLVRDTVSERLRRWTRNPLGSARRGSNPLGVACCARARGLRRKPMQVRPPGIEPGTICKALQSDALPTEL